MLPLSDAALATYARSVDLQNISSSANVKPPASPTMDVYFSADVETDGPIPGRYSMLSIGIVRAGTFDGKTFERPERYDQTFYTELQPISDQFQNEALKINGLDRDRLLREGKHPELAMADAARFIHESAGNGRPVLVAYPLSFDWTWLYWYFTAFYAKGSPFDHSRCFDIKTAFAVKAQLPIASAGRSRLPEQLRTTRQHSHHALDDAIEQAEIFANIFEWEGNHGSSNGSSDS